MHIPARCEVDSWQSNTNCFSSRMVTQLPATANEEMFGDGLQILSGQPLLYTQARCGIWGWWETEVTLPTV